MARTIEEIKKLIKQLKKVTVENGSAENEARIAAEVIQNMLLKYHLELNDIEATEENKKKEIVKEIMFETGRLMWYDETLLATTQKYFMVNSYIMRLKHLKKSQIYIMGWKEDIEIYKEFYNIINHLMKTSYKNHKDVDKNQYYNGFIKAIVDILEFNKNKNKDKWDLVVINDDLNNELSKLHAKKRNKSGIAPKFSNSVEAYSKGYDNGKQAYNDYSSGNLKNKLEG